LCCKRSGRFILDATDRHYPGRTRFIPADSDVAWQTRLRDRFYDLYVHLPAQNIIGDRLRPAAAKDPHGVEQARARLRSCYAMIDRQMAGSQWAMGEALGLADCAALPARFYANKSSRLARSTVT
jgi:glutathione S-transferase